VPHVRTLTPLHLPRGQREARVRPVAGVDTAQFIGTQHPLPLRGQRRSRAVGGADLLHL